MESHRVGIAVIILSLNQTEMTIRCVHSLRRILPGESPFSILVWDNGSDENEAEALSHLESDVLVHRSSDNLGVAGGRNAAAALATETWHPSHLLFLDNDMEVEPGFVHALLRPFLQDVAIGQTQAKLRFMDDRERLNDGGGCRINFMTGSTRPVGYGEIDAGQHDAMRPCVACGGAMMVRREVFDRLGGFDTIFNPFGPEDIDFSLRLAKAGYRALYVPDAVAYHRVSHTIGGDYDAQYAKAKARHWLTLLRRHAPLWQRVVFYGLTAPLLFLRISVREIRRGNPGAVRGLVSGMFGSRSRGTQSRRR